MNSNSRIHIPSLLVWITSMNSNSYAWYLQRYKTTTAKTKCRKTRWIGTACQAGIGLECLTESLLETFLSELTWHRFLAVLASSLQSQFCLLLLCSRQPVSPATWVLREVLPPSLSPSLPSFLPPSLRSALSPALNFLVPSICFFQCLLFSGMKLKPENFLK